MINSTEKSKYPMKWRDTCASWSWCWKLSQQTGRDGFPRQASNRKRPLGDNALELPLWHKQPSKVRGKTFFYISFKEVFFKRTPRMVKSHPPFFSVAFIPARKIICSAPRDTKRLSRIWDRFSNMFGENEAGIDVDILI